MALTGFAASMAVNTLMTGLIVFRILKVFLVVNAASTSVERTLGSTGGTKFQHTIFIIIESGMALFVIQLVRIVLANLPSAAPYTDFIIAINQMLNVITRSFHFQFFCFTDNIYLARGSHQQ